MKSKFFENNKPKFFYGYIVVAASFFLMAARFGIGFNFSVFLKPLIEEFGWTRAAVSGAYSFSFLAAGLVGLFIGRLNDRIGPRWIVFGGGFVFGLTFYLMSHINSIWQLYLAYFVINGIAGSTIWVPLLATVARWFVKRRGLMSAFISTGGGIGLMIMLPIVESIIRTYGWRNAYIVLGIIGLVIIILAAQFLRRDPSQKGLEPYGIDNTKTESLDIQARGLSVKEASHTIQLWALFIMLFSVMFIGASIQVHFVANITDLGFSAATAVNILVVMSGAAIPGRFIVGITADKFGTRPTLIGYFIIQTIAIFYLIIAKELWMFYLFAIIFGFFRGTSIVLLPLQIAEIFGMRALSILIAIIDFGGTIGDATGPFLAGYTFDMTSNYQLAFLICAGVSVLGLILSLLFIKPMTVKKNGQSI